MKFVWIFIFSLSFSSAASARLLVSFDEKVGKESLKKMVAKFNREKFNLQEWITDIKTQYPSADDIAHLDRMLKIGKGTHGKAKVIYTDTYLEFIFAEKVYGRISEIDGDKKTVQFRGKTIDLNEKSLIALHKSLLEAMKKPKKTSFWQQGLWEDAHAFEVLGFSGTDAGPAVTVTMGMLLLQKLLSRAQAATPEAQFNQQQAQNFEEIIISAKSYCSKLTGDDEPYSTYFPNHKLMLDMFVMDARANSEQACDTLTSEYFTKNKDTMQILEERKYRITKLCKLSLRYRELCKAGGYPIGGDTTAAATPASTTSTDAATPATTDPAPPPTGTVQDPTGPTTN